MLKRSFDFALSLTNIIFSLPLWILFSLLILFEDGFPIFYRQERVGKGGRIFNALKFRSMIKDAEKDNYYHFVINIVKEPFINYT